VSRLYPALDVIWPLQPDEERIDLFLAEVDDEGPLAVEEITSGLRLFFPTGTARGLAAVKLIALEPDLVCTPQDVPDEDWAARSQASIGPITVGCLLVVPPWLAADAGGRFMAPVAGETATAGVIRVIIQPSMGFGTAHHASTRLCLRLLQDVPLAGRSVLDVGTGSGVLAIAAAKLGAAEVVGIDNDQDALTSARENVELNRVPVALELSGLEHRSAERAFDVVLGNLTGALLIREAPALRSRLAEDGVLIVSGVTEAEGAGVKAAFVDAGLAVGQEIAEDGWVSLSFTIPTSSRGH
jgi:ribosomal protein L11 methyltransferase